jgi:hypothetical protein
MCAASLSDIRPDDIVEARDFEPVQGFPLRINPGLIDALNDARVNLTAHIIGTDPDFAQISHTPRVRMPEEKPADTRYEDQRDDYMRLLTAQGVPQEVASAQFDSDLTEITGRLNAVALKGAAVIPPSTRVTPDEVDAALAVLKKISAGTVSVGGTEEALDRASERLVEIKRRLGQTQSGNRSRAI